MADRLRAYPQNAPGEWFVDDRCIDCGICRWLAPDSFGQGPGHAIVSAQPSDLEAAGRAALSCPTGAIGGPATALQAARLPHPVLPGVFFCGYASRETYAAQSWLLQRPDGNVLVDVPRPVPALLDRIEALGGVRTLVLTHRDDVHGHQKLAARFGAERVMHEADLDQGTATVEHRVVGEAPVTLAPDLVLIPVPGHTRGSMCLLYRGEVLFSGDHLWGAAPLRAQAGASGGSPSLGAGRSVCWYSWAAQTQSMEALLDWPFAHVLPGHGRPWHGGFAAREPALLDLIAGMKRARA